VNCGVTLIDIYHILWFFPVNLTLAVSIASSDTTGRQVDNFCSLVF